MKINDLKKGFGELTLEDKMSFLTDIGANYSGDTCFKCKKQIITNHSFKVQIRYGNKTFDNLVICQECISNIFNIKLYKIEFFGFLENFRKLRFLSIYDMWSKKDTIIFIKQLKDNLIKVDENKEVCRDCRYSESKAFTLIDLIKKHRLQKHYAIK